MRLCETELSYDCVTPRSLVVRFCDLEFSSDAGILLVRQVEETVGIGRLIVECIQQWCDLHNITLSLYPLVSQ